MFILSENSRKDCETSDNSREIDFIGRVLNDKLALSHLSRLKWWEPGQPCSECRSKNNIVCQHVSHLSLLERMLRFLLEKIFQGSTYLSPLPFVMFTNFSIPPVSAKALAFSIFLLVTSCKAQQIAATVSSERIFGPFPPGRRFTRSRMAYLPKKIHIGKPSYKLHCNIYFFFFIML